MNFKLNDMDQITPDLYLGNSSSSTNVSKLKELGIKKVLSVMDCGSPKYNDKDNIIHKTVSVCDISSQNIIKYFGECLNFIKGKRKSFSSLYGRSQSLCYHCYCVFNVGSENDLS